MTFVLFSKVESFLRRILVSRKLQYSIWYHEIFVFSELCLSPKTFLIAEKLIVFSCLQFADYYIWPRILSCGVIFVRLSLLRKSLLWKVFFKKTLSWCCRKHVFVFEIVSLRGLNKFDQIIFFPWLLGKRFSIRQKKKFENFSVLGVDFLLV